MHGGTADDRATMEGSHITELGDGAMTTEGEQGTTKTPPTPTNQTELTTTPCSPKAAPP